MAENRVSEKKGPLRRLWNSVFIEPVYPRTSRERKRNAFDALILHIHPPTVPEKTLRFSLTWGLGGTALVLLLLMVLTGALLLFAYDPVPGAAYESVEALQAEVPFGKLVRAVHHWSANLLCVVALLHLLRVFFTGAFTGPRKFNWVIGLFLLFLVLASNFTGYLLPWDQRAFWAVTICTSMLGYVSLAGPWLQQVLRGGAEVGPATLRTFSVLHTTLLPLSFLFLLPFHFWRVRKAGGVVVPRAPGEEEAEKKAYVLTIPHLVIREGVTALAVIAAVLLFSVFIGAPLGDPANPGMSPNPAKAPWYFLGLQELLLHFHPLFAVFVIPLLLTAALLFLPYLGLSEGPAGVWFVSDRGRRVGLHSAVAALVLTPLLVAVDEWIPGSAGGSFPSWLTGGLIPLGLLLAGFGSWYLGMRKKGGASRNEAFQGIFIFLAVAFIVLTITGIWFRGEGGNGADMAVNEPARRGFLRKLWILLGLAALAEGLWLAAAFLRPRQPRTGTGEPAGIVAAGRVGDFEPGSVTAFPGGRFYLARLEDGGFLALSRTCTHLGCTVLWVEEEGKFVCPCHASAFDIRGEVVSPPAPRALDTYPLRIEGDVIKVETVGAVPRKRFSPSQVVYPS